MMEYRITTSGSREAERIDLAHDLQTGILVELADEKDDKGHFLAKDERELCYKLHTDPVRLLKALNILVSRGKIEAAGVKNE